MGMITVWLKVGRLKATGKSNLMLPEELQTLGKKGSKVRLKDLVNNKRLLK